MAEQKRKSTKVSAEIKVAVQGTLPEANATSELIQASNKAADIVKDLDSDDLLLNVSAQYPAFLVYAKPPDMHLIRRRFVLGLKDEFKQVAVLFAAQMACNGFVGKRIDQTCTIRVGDKVVSFGEARMSNFQFEKEMKGDAAVNPRRVCMAFSKSIRKYIEKNPVITTTMKKYGGREAYLFIGGQESVSSVNEAQKLVTYTSAVDGDIQSAKLVKYFMAREINIMKT